MNKQGLIVLLLLIMSLLGGCSSKTIEIPEDTYEDRSLRNSSFVKQELYRQYKEWKGTRYRMGGLNKKGIDCSGFVYITFKHKFSILLPRTTEDMAKLGITVDIGEWRPGDLIFFKTGIFDRHVGVYIDDGQFLHASTSQGVIISELYSPYWNKTYWKTKRI
ncbi:MAG: C40 family peptidase [Desulfamplus sp.]|nr:C40 family peptidase [Desulfamplus sp.]